MQYESNRGICVGGPLDGKEIKFDSEVFYVPDPDEDYVSLTATLTQRAYKREYHQDGSFCWKYEG